MPYNNIETFIITYIYYFIYITIFKISILLILLYFPFLIDFL